MADAGLARARIWRLYMAGSALGFEAGRINVHQIVAVPAIPGASGVPPRPDWDATARAAWQRPDRTVRPASEPGTLTLVADARTLDG